MSGAPLFTLVIFMKVDGRQHFITLLMFVLNFFYSLTYLVKGRQYFITLLMLVLNFAF